MSENIISADHHRDPTSPPPPQITKSNPKFLSMILKALIMSLLTSLFFLFLGVAAIVLLHICLAGRHLHRRQNHHHLSDNIGYSPDDLKKLPRFRYAKSPNSTTECAVCLENFRERELCRSLPACGHVFHSNCVDSWLVKVPACPLCRARVRLGSGAFGDGSGVEEFKQMWAVRA